jgi:hypothetical protein
MARKRVAEEDLQNWPAEKRQNADMSSFASTDVPLPQNFQASSFYRQDFLAPTNFVFDDSYFDDMNLDLVEETSIEAWWPTGSTIAAPECMLQYNDDIHNNRKFANVTPGNNDQVHNQYQVGQFPVEGQLGIDNQYGENDIDAEVCYGMVS